jgi:hypothetical protein
VLELVAMTFIHDFLANEEEAPYSETWLFSQNMSIELF